MKPIHALAMFVVVAAACPADAGTIVQTRDAVTLTIETDESIALSDTINATLRIEGTSLAFVDEPGKLPDDAPWTLVRRWPVERAAAGPNRQVVSVRFAFAPRAPGEKVPFQFPAYTYQDGKQKRTVAFDPCFVKVTTSIRDPDVAQIREEPSIEPLPAVEPVRRGWLVALALGTIVVLIAAGVFLYRRRRGRDVTHAPAERALREWHRLVGMKLPEKGHATRFVTILTVIVRRFLERQFALPARRQTTPEFLQQLAQTSLLGPDEKAFLTTFLQRCDAVKFADQDVSADECGKLAEHVHQFLTRRLHA